jgi:hypothetical protein
MPSQNIHGCSASLASFSFPPCSIILAIPVLSASWVPVVNSLQNELHLSNGSVYEKLLGHVWFIGFDCLNQLPGAQQCRSKQDGVLAFFSH